jgi:hypothetical protein
VSGPSVGSRSATSVHVPAPDAGALLQHEPNGSWWRPGFPLAYVSDILEILELLVELGYARDPRLARALAWLESTQDADGRWANRHERQDVDRHRSPGRGLQWVTLRACGLLRAAYE